VQEEVHRAQARGVVDDFVTAERLVDEEPQLLSVKLVVLDDVVEGGQQEPAGAARGVPDGLARLRLLDLGHRPRDGTRREVLAGSGLRVVGVLLQQPLVRVALDVGVHARRGFLVDEVNDEASKLRRVLDAVLRLAEDEAEESLLSAQPTEKADIVGLEVRARLRRQRGPVIVGRQTRSLIARGLGALVGHLEEQQVRELLHVVAIRQAVVTQDVAVVPKLRDERAGVVGHDSRHGCPSPGTARPLLRVAGSPVNCPLRAWYRTDRRRASACSCTPSIDAFKLSSAAA
jgi:hypothetical protein